MHPGVVEPDGIRRLHGPVVLAWVNPGFIVSDDHWYWPDDGAFWPDELDSYRIKLDWRCPRRAGAYPQLANRR